MTEIHEGGCACGAVRYRVRGRPKFASVCHCTFCQRRLASAFAVLASFDDGAVEFLTGLEGQPQTDLDRTLHPEAPGIWNGHAGRQGASQVSADRIIESAQLFRIKFAVSLGHRLT